MTVDRLIPSVEDAASQYAGAEYMRDIWSSFCGCRDRCHECTPCCWSAGRVENAALALDMALAQASDARRAEADRLCSEVAW